MFSVNGMPWWIGTDHDHGQAHLLGDHPTWEAARVYAGLDWDPTEEDLYRRPDMDKMRKAFARVLINEDDRPVEDKVDLLAAHALTAMREVRDFKFIGRSDDADAELAATQLSYKVIPNSEFGEIFDALLEQDNVKYETGGSLDGGRQVWMLAKLDEPIVLPGDSTATYPYFSLMSRHDAKGSTALRATNVRIVCGNTFDYAELQGDSNGLVYRFVHRGEWRGHLEEAKAAVTGVRKSARQYEELAKYLIEVPVTRDQETKFTALFFPEPPRGEASDKVLENVAASRAKLHQILRSETVAGAGVYGTAYGLLQGAGEYSDWAVRSRNWETRVRRTLLKPDAQKRRALQILGEVCDLDLKKSKVTQEISEAGLLIA